MSSNQRNCFKIAGVGIPKSRKNHNLREIVTKKIAVKVIWLLLGVLTFFLSLLEGPLVKWVAKHENLWFWKHYFHILHRQRRIRNCWNYTPIDLSIYITTIEVKSDIMYFVCGYLAKKVGTLILQPWGKKFSRRKSDPIQGEGSLLP